VIGWPTQIAIFYCHIGKGWQAIMFENILFGGLYRNWEKTNTVVHSKH